MATSQPTLLDRYALHGEIASGGMATVHVGRLLGTAGFSRTVAIKRLYPQYARDPEFAAMFLEEARLVSRIRNPNVIQTLDVVAKGGEIFIVMEYVAGESLSRLLVEHGARGDVPPTSVAVAVMYGALHGLHAAHEAKSEAGEPLRIVHRDVSPQNVLVGLDGVPFVLDFGIARATGDPLAMRDERLKGKLPYMAPEQLLGAEVDRRTDIYAASVVLWETLTGRRLFEAASDDALIRRIKEGRVEPPSRHASVSAELDRLVMRGLATDPAGRFATAREMAAALERTEKLATALEIASWVENLAGATIRKRNELVAAIERDGSPPERGDRDSEPTRLMPADQGSEAVTREVEPPTREIVSLVRAHDATPGGVQSNRNTGTAVSMRLLIGLSVAAAILVAIVGITWSRARFSPGAPSARLPDSAAADSPTAVEPHPTETIALPASVPSIVPLPEVEVSSAPHSAPAKPSPHNPCDPPYFVDAHGIRRIKRQCVPN